MKNLLTVKRVFDIISSSVREVSHSKKYLARHNKKCISVCKYSNYNYCHIFMNINFSRQFFLKKISNIKFHEFPSSGIRFIQKIVTERNGHDEGGFSYF